MPFRFNVASTGPGFYSVGPAIVVIGMRNIPPSPMIPILQVGSGFSGSNLALPAESAITPVVLGTFETKPKIIMTYSFAQFQTDEGGGKETPEDRCYNGREAVVTGVMNWFDMPVMMNVMNQAAALGWDLQGNPLDPRGLTDLKALTGRDTVDSLGVLMGREQRCFELWIVFPRNIQPNMAARGCIPGYHFPQAFLDNPAEIEPSGGEYKQLVTFRCQRKRIQNPASGIAIIGGIRGLTGQSELMLYDHLGLNGSPMNNLPVLLGPG